MTSSYCGFNKSSVVKWIQQLVVVTAKVWPLSVFSAFLYRAIAILAGKVIFLYARPIAVYVRRSIASGDFLPGVSDIDLSVVIADHSLKVHQRACRAHRGLSKICPLFGDTTSEFGIYELRDIKWKYNLDTHFRYRIEEGRHHWHLVAGRDILSKVLPTSLNDDTLRHATDELKVWWHYICTRLLATQQAPRSANIQRNYLWYKIIAETYKVRFAIQEPKLIPSRQEAVARVRLGAWVDTTVVPVDRVKSLASDNDLLAHFFNIARSAAHEAMAKTKTTPVTFALESGKSFYRNCDEHLLLRAILPEVTIFESLETYYRLLPSDDSWFGSCALVIQAEFPPTFNQLRDLTAVCRSEYPNQKCWLHLEPIVFLLNGEQSIYASRSRHSDPLFWAGMELAKKGCKSVTIDIDVEDMLKWRQFKLFQSGSTASTLDSAKSFSLKRWVLGLKNQIEAKKIVIPCPGNDLVPGAKAPVTR